MNANATNDLIFNINSSGTGRSGNKSDNGIDDITSGIDCKQFL